MPVVAAVLVIRPLAMALCLGSGAEGGLFTPTLTFGALVGSLLGHGWSVLWPGGDIAAFTMIGATAMLAGTMQSPLAAIALVVELTHSGIDLIVPMALAVTGALVVSRFLEPWSIYTVGGHVRRPHWARLRMPGAAARASLAAPLHGDGATGDRDEATEGRTVRHDSAEAPRATPGAHAQDTSGSHLPGRASGEAPNPLPLPPDEPP